MTWKERTFTEITFTSPVGTTYVAKWRGGSRDAEKSLGIFKAPGVPGSIVQDLERAAITYDLTIHFDGIDHDVIAGRFFTECGATRGVWDVIHPVKGRLKLQLVSYSEVMEPVSNANITTVITEWIEPNILEGTVSAETVRAGALEGITNLNDSGAFQFVKDLATDTFESVVHIISSATGVIDVYNRTLFSIVRYDAELKAQIEAIQAQIISNINAPVINTTVLAGQFQNLIQLPARVVENIEGTTALYNEFLNRVLSLRSDLTVDPNVLTAASRNEVLVNEISTVSALGAITDVIIDGELTTRKQTIEIINGLNTTFQTVTNALDEHQEALTGEYFSQSESYSDSINMLANAVRYLIISSFDLKIEKRVTLDRPKTPAFITIEQYGALGENDQTYDFFLTSNALKANDILLLPPGREVLIYQ